MIFGSNASIIEFADFEGNSTTRVEGEKGLGNLLRNVRYVILTACFPLPNPYIVV